MHERANPHHWLDPVQTAVFVEQLGEQLATHEPEHRESIERNTKELLAVVHAVDDEYRTRLHKVKRRELVTFHNAFDLLAARYDLQVVAHLTPIELTPGGEIAPARLQQAVEVIKRLELPVIYVEPQFPQRTIIVLQQHANVQVLRLDPLGNPRRPAYATWQAMMRSNLDTLVDGQNRETK